MPSFGDMWALVRHFVRNIISLEGRMISEISLDRLLPEREALAA